jgi:hypothetical protein
VELDHLYLQHLHGLGALRRSPRQENPNLEPIRIFREISPEGFLGVNTDASHTGGTTQRLTLARRSSKLARSIT